MAPRFPCSNRNFHIVGSIRKLCWPSVATLSNQCLFVELLTVTSWEAKSQTKQWTVRPLTSPTSDLQTWPDLTVNVDVEEEVSRVVISLQSVASLTAHQLIADHRFGSRERIAVPDLRIAQTLPEISRFRIGVGVARDRLPDAVPRLDWPRGHIARRPWNKGVKLHDKKTTTKSAIYLHQIYEKILYYIIL